MLSATNAPIFGNSWTKKSPRIPQSLRLADLMKEPENNGSDPDQTPDSAEPERMMNES
ncbi:MAG TPA: hypothetical protein VMU07_01825 [Candidatus Paceibacterota bacterium]|nr:hypothetical protein [Candidatus Paceibacterota bacterium]